MTPSLPSGVTVRKATVRDAEPILDLVNDLADQQVMLPRSPASVIEHLRDFTIVENDGQFAGCGALHIAWSDLAEVRSLAVNPRIQRKGLGRVLVDHLAHEAEELGIARLFAFTYVPGFFERLGFSVVEHQTLPHKVFQDCLNCPKFHRCDEIAMERVLSANREVHLRGPLSRPSDGLPLPAKPARRATAPKDAAAEGR
ncbi:MAG: N-acetyltransferase [Planctomycetota bacterium]